MRTREWTSRSFCSRKVRRTSGFWCLLPALLLTVLPALAQDPAGRFKNIHGVVRDLRGDPIPGARVFVRNMDTNVTRTLITGADGTYSATGLPPDESYEVSAEYQGAESGKRIVSSFLPRTDNVLHFQLEVAVVSGPAGGDGGGFRLETFDRVELRASFEMPVGVPAPVPAALLLHGYGENRAVWQDLESRLLDAGWAVMTVDLRGHGASLTRNGQPIGADPSWRADARQFPLDVEPALRWLQSQPRLDGNRIAVIGFDVGANLALLASGRYPEVGTVVAIRPELDEAMALAGTAREFTPRTAHLIVSDRAAGDRLRSQVRGISRITVVPAAGGTPVWLATGNTMDEILRWLRDTY